MTVQKEFVLQWSASYLTSEDLSYCKDAIAHLSNGEEVKSVKLPSGKRASMSYSNPIPQRSEMVCFVTPSGSTHAIFRRE